LASLLAGYSGIVALRWLRRLKQLAVPRHAGAHRLRASQHLRL
jgi:hypothetical protein